MKRRFFPPRLIIPATFTDCLTYEQQLLWLLAHKSDVLKAGDNITLTENDDGTITISAEGGVEYTIQKTTSEGVVSYKLIDGDGTQYGDTIVVPPGHSYTIHEYIDEEEPGFRYELLNENGERCGDVIVMQDYDHEYRIEKEEDEMYDLYTLVDKYGDQQGEQIEVPHIPEIHDYTIEGEQNIDDGGWDYQLLEDEDPVGDPIHVPGPELPAGGDDGQVLKVIGDERDLTWGYVNGNTVYPRTEIMYHKYSDAKEVVEINRHAFSEEPGFGTEISNDGNNHYTITFNDEGEYDGMVLKIRGTDGLVTFDDPTDKNAWLYPFVGDYVQFMFNVQVTTTPVSIGFTLDNGGYVTTDYYYELFRYGQQLNDGNTYDVLMKNSSMSGDYMWQSPYTYIKDLATYNDASGAQHTLWDNTTVSQNYLTLIGSEDLIGIGSGAADEQYLTSLGLLALKKVALPPAYEEVSGNITDVTPSSIGEFIRYNSGSNDENYFFNIVGSNMSLWHVDNTPFKGVALDLKLDGLWIKELDKSNGGIDFDDTFLGTISFEYNPGSGSVTVYRPCIIRLRIKSSQTTLRTRTNVRVDCTLLGETIKFPTGTTLGPLFSISSKTT